MLVQLDPSGVLHRQIYDAFRRAILAGGLPSGQRLPSTRSLATDLGVSRNVVLLAFEQLAAEGFVTARRGAGTYVATSLPEGTLHAPDDAPGRRPPRPPRLSPYGERALAQRDDDARPPLEHPPAPRFDFRYGRPALDSALLRSLRRHLSRQVPSLPDDYGPPEGLPSLRRAVADYLRRVRGVRCDADGVLVSSGSQQALDLVARTLLAPGERVAIEEPHYGGARRLFAAAGAGLTPVAVDANGLDPSRLPTGGARLVYVTPSHQFPTGATMPLARRLALLEWADEHDAYLVEDDYDSEFRYAGRPLAAIQGLDRQGRVIYVGTFSKVLSPALRLGFLVLPDALVHAFRATKWLADRHTPSLVQAALAELIASGDFARHLRRSRARYAARRQALLAAIERTLGERVEVVGTNAGIHLLVWLRGLPAEAAPALVAAARTVEVGVYPVAPYYLTPPARLGLLFGYAALDEAEIGEGVERFAAVVEALSRDAVS